MPRYVVALLAVLLSCVGMSGRAEAAGVCVPFSGFPLSINFGTGVGSGTGESINCFGTKIQAAFNMMGQPNGIATLDANGDLLLSQLPPAVTLTGTLSADLTYAGTPNPNVVAARPGNAVSFCPALSCINGPTGGPVNSAYFDHQRASLLISGASVVDAQAEEQLLAVTMTIGTGYAPAWKASTAYAVGANITIGNAAYRATTAGTSGTTAPPGTRPTSLPYTFQDGTVTWLWINDAAINAKLPGYFEAMAVPGAGQVWGLVSNLHLTAGVIPTFAASSEVDFSNDSGTNCVAGLANCIGQYIRVKGANSSTAGQSIELSGGGAIFGSRIVGNPSNATLSVSTTGGTAGLGLGDFSAATFTTAAINDASTAPASLNITGTKSLAAIRVAATTPTGIDLSGGTYSTWQILGKSWSIDTVGNLAVASVRETSSNPPASSSASCTVGQHAWDANYEYRCVAANTWKRAALSTW